MEMPPCKQPKLSSNITSSSSEVFSNFYLQYHCTKTGLTEKGEIKLESLPHTQDVLAVKKQVEKQFSIPVCVQTVSYNGHTLKNDDKLSELRVRNGDTFHVEYLAKADCTSIMEIISWLEQLCSAMVTASLDLDDIIEDGIQQDLLESLEKDFFSPWYDPTSKSYVNKLFFVDKSGISLILKVYEFLLQKTWNKMTENYNYVERWIIESMWSFAETVPLCRLLIQHNIIQMVTKSLLRVRLEEGRMIEDLDASGDHYQQDILIETIHNCIGVFLK